MSDARIRLNPTPLADAERRAILANPVFGQVFTDHMVTMEYRNGAWGPLELKPFAPLVLSPATLALHYGQSIFEALKAYSLGGHTAGAADGTADDTADDTAGDTADDTAGDTGEGIAALFRPDQNEARFATSARRIAIPELPEGVFGLGCALLAGADRAWIPSEDGAALYVRPFIFGSEAHLSVRPAEEYLFVIIASPVASYFGEHLSAITVGVEAIDVRATPGGTGAVKFAGNYAAGFAAHRRAGAAGYDQVLWLDADEHRWVEELNAMNVFFVWRRDGRTVVTTPPLAGTILAGVTRDSLLSLAADAVAGRPGGEVAVGAESVDEAAVGIDEVAVERTSIEMIRAGAADGSLVEMFACGTAAVIAPIGTVVDDGRPLTVGTGEPGPVTIRLRRSLLDVQQGLAADPHEWMVPVADLLQSHGVDPADLRAV